jgi:hypothetical protein
VLVNRDFVAHGILDNRLVRVTDGALRGPSDFYLVWPRYRKSDALNTVLNWITAEAWHPQITGYYGLELGGSFASTNATPR